MNWIQLKALIWLRWRLTVNQWRRNHRFGPVFTIILAIIFLGIVVCGAAAGLAGGAMGLANAPPTAMMLTWDVLVVVFMFLWTLGIILELQRSEVIDQNRLMHLPISPWSSFVLNYLASHLSFSLAFLFPGMLGLAAGLAIGRGPVMMFLLPLVFFFFFMITAWTYCLRSWLASLMVNKRRRRTIIAGVTIAFVLLCQLPNLLVNGLPSHRQSNPALQTMTDQEKKKVHREEMAQKLHTFEEIHKYVPVLWLPQGARSLMEGRMWPVVWGGFGMLGLGLMGLTRAYLTTLRFYRGEKDSKAIKPPSAEKQKNPGSKLLVEWAIPSIPEEASALAFANLRAMARASEVKMALAINVFIIAVIGSGVLMHKSGSITESFEPFVAMGAIILTFMGLSQLMFNHFGFDRDGFRLLVLSPALRRNILLGKNLALLPVACILFAVFLGLMTVLLHLPPSAILASVLGFCGGFPALSIIGNYLSITIPYRMEAGTLKATKVKGSTQLLIGAAQLLFPFAILPLFIPVGLGWMCDHFNWLPGTIVMIAGSLLLALASAFIYWRMLGPMGNLLQRREQKILQVVKQQVE